MAGRENFVGIYVPACFVSERWNKTSIRRRRRSPSGHFFLSDGGRLSGLKHVGVSDEVGTMCTEILLDQRQNHLYSNSNGLPGIFH